MKLSQAAFAALGGVSRGSQIAYEQGRADPAASYLQKLAEAGINVGYLLTGRRHAPLDPDDDFYKLLVAYLELAGAPELQNEIVSFAQFQVARSRPMKETDPDEIAAMERADRIIAALREGLEPPGD